MVAIAGAGLRRPPWHTIGRSAWPVCASVSTSGRASDMYTGKLTIPLILGNRPVNRWRSRGTRGRGARDWRKAMQRGCKHAPYGPERSAHCSRRAPHAGLGRPGSHEACTRQLQRSASGWRRSLGRAGHGWKWPEQPRLPRRGLKGMPSHGADDERQCDDRQNDQEHEHSVARPPATALHVGLGHLQVRGGPFRVLRNARNLETRLLFCHSAALRVSGQGGSHLRAKGCCANWELYNCRSSS